MIKRLNQWEVAVLFLGDILIFYVSLWITLFLRHLTVPDAFLWDQHLAPFTILFIVWLVVFFIAGLYEKHTTILKSKLPNTILNTQVIASIIAIFFFYLIPYFGITPKTTLFIYLVVSFVLVLFWRRYVAVTVGARKQQPAILVGSGNEMRELLREVNQNPRYGMHFVSSVDIDEVESMDFKGEIVDRIYTEGIGIVVIDTNNERVEPILPKLYNFIFSHVRFIDMHRVYEDIFDRVPLSLVEYSWFLENVSVTRRFTYEFVKRLMDLVLALPLFLLSLVAYPFIVAAIKLDDGGKTLIFQERIGKNNQHIQIAKFRTMTGEDTDEQVLNSAHVVTRVGKLLRVTRIDELPQLWSVVRGRLSLIGPRPELPALVRHYEDEIPYYNIRHLIKPGLSGWAQLYHDDHPHHGIGIEETKTKLSYDLYYIKNRSLLLDVRIALKTIKKLLLRAGR